MQLAVMRIWKHVPDQWERLKAEPSLMPSAVEELLRFENPSQHTARLAPEDTELVVGADKGVLANDTDPDDGDLTATLSTPPSRGTLVAFNPDGSFTYQPKQDFNGVDVFTYEVANQSGKAATGRVQLFVGPQGDVIITTDDRYQLVQDVSLTVTAPGVLTNDVDPDGDKLALSVVKDVAHGKLELNHDGSFLYAPAQHFTGSDGFTYRVKDSDGNQATADVAILVRPEDAPPPLIDAITDQLGLRVEKRKGEVEFLIVDSVDKSPTEN